MFGELSCALNRAKHKYLFTIEDVVVVYEDYWRTKEPKPIDEWLFLDYFPPPKKEVECTPFTLPSLLGIAASFAFSCRVNDRRRADRLALHSRTDWSLLSGLTYRNLGSTGKQAGVGRSGFPVLDLTTEADEPIMHDLAAELLPHMASHLGWRCSYQKSDHAHSEEAAERRRLHLGRLALEARPRAAGSAEPTRHMPMAEDIARQVQSGQRKRLLKKQQNDFFKTLRDP
jgi:hypothetical protein